MDYPGIQSICVASSGEFLVALIGESSASTAELPSPETSSGPCRVQVWSREGKLLLDQLLGGPGTTAVVSSDDSLLAIGTSDGKGVQLWNTKTWQLIADIPTDAGSRVEAIAFSDDNHWLAFASSTNKLANSRVIWDLQKQELVRAETTTGPDPFRAAIFKRGSEPIVQTCTERGVVELWAHHQNSNFQPVLRTGTRVNALAFSPAGQMVAAGMGPYFAIWNCTDSRREHAVNNVLADVQCVAFSATGREVCWAAGSALQCLDAKSKRAIASFSTRGGHVVSLAVLPKAAGVWAACDDEKLMFWSTPIQDALEDGASHR
jgi:WD40 repeat protein